jgi:hypothetical protein
MIEIPDRHEVDEAMPQGPIITSHRFAASRLHSKGLRSNDGSSQIIPIINSRTRFENLKATKSQSSPIPRHNRVSLEKKSAPVGRAYAKEYSSRAKNATGYSPSRAVMQ